jgi:hypothetical protein
MRYYEIVREESEPMAGAAKKKGPLGTQPQEPLGPITYEELTPAQKQIVDAAVSDEEEIIPTHLSDEELWEWFKKNM